MVTALAFVSPVETHFDFGSFLIDDFLTVIEIFIDNFDGGLEFIEISAEDFEAEARNHLEEILVLSWREEENV